MAQTSSNDQVIEDRIARIYASIDAVVETDLSNLTPTIFVEDKLHVVEFDFGGNASHAEIENAAHLLIANIASLGNHVRRWARRMKKDLSAIGSLESACPAIPILIDLWGNEKHGQSERSGDRGKSKRAPLLGELSKSLDLRSGSEPHSGISLSIPLTGEAITQGDGPPNIVISGPIHDDSGEYLGELIDVARDALTCWEELLSEWGIDLK